MIQNTNVVNLNQDSDGMRQLIEKYEFFPLADILFRGAYQRNIDKRKLRKIEASIIDEGYWDSEVIVLNEHNQVVDGQHRAQAAIDCGLEYIPAIKYKWPSEQAEARYFAKKNNFNNILVPKDYWRSLYLADDSVAKVLHSLAEDPKCSLFEKIPLKGEACKKPYSINLILYSLSIAMDGAIGKFYSRDRHDEWVSIVENTTYPTLVTNTNHLFVWFEDCFGPKEKGSIPHQVKIMQVLFHLYTKLWSAGHLSNGNYKSSVKKMQKYIWTDKITYWDSISMMKALLSHYNSGKRKTRIEE